MKITFMTEDYNTNHLLMLMLHNYCGDSHELVFQFYSYSIIICFRLLISIKIKKIKTNIFLTQKCF